VGLTWGRISSVSGARRRSSGRGRRSGRRRSSGRGVVTVNFMHVMMLTLRVVPKTRGGAEFETTFHSGRLSLGISGYYVV
jgi:hypothetical protein